jgi:hypothetical protein
LNAARSQQNRLPESIRDKTGSADCGFKIDGATVSHIQLVTSLVEGRFVGLAEVAALLDKILRQHSIDIEGKFPYAGFYHPKQPP